MKNIATNYKIDTSRDGQRIDNFLFTRLKGVPKGLIYRLLRTGKIRVNGKKVKQTYRLQEDDEVRIPDISVPDSMSPSISERIKSQIEASCIFEDENILAINKPAGLAVHPGSKVSYGVIEVLRAIRTDAPYLELVHRLDRETSGCLLIAKNKHSLNALHDQFRREDLSNEVEKIYTLLVKGRWNLGEKVIDTPLQSKGQNSVVDDQKNAWKEAYTTFIPIEYYKGFTLLNAEIKTGRTHQIRLHASQVGFPIVGDDKHGDFRFNKECRKKGFKRMFLHAREISFHLPASKQENMPANMRGHLQKTTITAPLDKELKAFLEGLDS